MFRSASLLHARAAFMAKRSIDSKAPWPGWKLFSERDADGKQKCLVPVGLNKVCGECLTYKNTTANFKNHLKRVHPAIASELDARREELTSDPSPPSVPAPDQTRLNDFFDPLKVATATKTHKILVDRLEHAVVEFVAGDIRPFNAVEGPRVSPFPSPEYSFSTSSNKQKKIHFCCRI
jgi:hypothetical protein